MIGVTSAYGSTACVHEQAAAQSWLLLERVIDGQRRARHDVLVVDIGRDADDAARRRCSMSMNFITGSVHIRCAG